MVYGPNIGWGDYIRLTFPIADFDLMPAH